MTQKIYINGSKIIISSNKQDLSEQKDQWQKHWKKNHGKQVGKRRKKLLLEVPLSSCEIRVPRPISKHPPIFFYLLVNVSNVKCRLDDSQAGIKIAGRNINNLRYADDTTLMAESKEELKMTVKEESESWLKTQYSKNENHGIWSHHLMANRWWKSRNSDRFYFLGLRNQCRHWLQPQN